ncbi:sodium:solute symporter family transporter [Alteromonas stellipolaris]|uniref:sodium:solute symporter family transporter n=1 Tax=Alteromonas stellipolaris TaxID=233316 RepID=UPI0026E2EFC9|nr:sodium/solute symporter [Alteromonas stellipolaris]MDO6536156.1 sodium/solute symporter [Alteromonas stellipolaris]MDO6628253.1 sodium/solute symporter [Alteromonas stellipolaris]
MNFVDFTVVAIYLVGLLVMGFVFRKQVSKKDYFLANRQLGWKPLSLSIMATQLSAVSFISAPAFVGLREGGGLIWLSYELALPLAMLALLYFILPTLYRSGVVSVYDFLEQRFGRSSRVLISVVFQISRSFATAIMIYAISIILQSTMGLAFWQSVLLIGVITLIYSLQGGMKAVVYGDAVQMILIVAGALVCLGFGLYHIGGWTSFLEQVQPERLSTLNTSSYGFDGEGFGLLPMIFGGIVLYASYYGCDQSEAQRSLSARSLGDLKKIIMTASFLRFPITLIYCFAGLIIGTLALTTPEFLAQIPDDQPDWLMPIFIVNYLPNGILGLLLVAILAAAMSSLSSAINSLAAVSVEDYCRVVGKTLSPESTLQVAKYTGMFWGLLTLGLSFVVDDIAPTIIEAINKIGSVCFGPILATFFLGVCTKHLLAKQVNTGLIAGVLVNIYLWLNQPDVFWFWWNVTGFLTALSVSLGVYWLSPGLNQQKVKQPFINIRQDVLTKANMAALITWCVVLIGICIALPMMLI